MRHESNRHRDPACARPGGGAQARAGDGSAINVLGFSADGRYFAFEQYGEQDGSGSLYSTITAIEIAGDRLVKGMPVSRDHGPRQPGLGKEPREKQLADIRAQGRRRCRRHSQAARHLRAPGTWSRRCRTAGRAASSSPSRSRPRMKAVVQTVTLPADRFGPDARLVLREFDIALPRCKDLVIGRASQRIRADARAQGPPDHPSEPRPDHPGLARLPGQLRHRGGARVPPARRLDRAGRVDPLFLHGIRRTGPALHRGDGPGPLTTS